MQHDPQTGEILERCPACDASSTSSAHRRLCTGPQHVWRLDRSLWRDPISGKLPRQPGVKKSAAGAKATRKPGKDRFGRTPEERVEADKVRKERAAARAKEMAFLRELCPAMETQDDPPVRYSRPLVLHPNAAQYPNGLLVSLPRLSARGYPGSELVARAVEWDGWGNGGSVPQRYVGIFIVYRGGAGYRARSVGVTIQADELRPVAKALLEVADRLDKKDNA